MNIFILLFLFLSITYSSTEISDDSYNIIFDFIANAIKGMSKNETESSCANAFLEKREEIMKDFKDIINIITDEEYSINLLFHSISLILKIKEKCDLLKILLFANDLYEFNTTFIENIGLNTMRKSKTIKNNINNIFENKIIENKFQFIGKIFSLIFNFYF